MIDLHYPPWFPFQCSPADASDATGLVFRFVAGAAVSPTDFLSHYELGLAPRAQPCRRCSLSVYRTLESARAKLKELGDRYLGRFGSFIAAGQLAAEHGKLKQDGKDVDHHEWWSYDGVVRHEPFQVVESVSS